MKNDGGGESDDCEEGHGEELSKVVSTTISWCSRRGESTRIKVHGSL